MPATLQSIKENPLNKTFFSNAGVLGDEHYSYNPTQRHLSVRSKVWGDGNTHALSVWQVDASGKILNRISCEFDPPITQ